jgi:hypothetical protein
MFSKLIRRVHMYLALFFMPWMLIYALSTIAMNHRDFFRDMYGGDPVVWEKEQEQVYPGTFSEDAEPKSIGLALLTHLSLDGGDYSARRSPDGRSILVLRNDPVVPRRITYTPADRLVIVEKQLFRTSAFLERMHRRRGFESEYVLNDAWGVSVDLVIAAMVFWVFSGLWMWWELKATRTLGAVLMLAGAGLFAMFLFTI